MAKRNVFQGIIICCLLAGFGPRRGPAQTDAGLPPAELLPRIDGWVSRGQPESYQPANLYEYINGAAEIYLAYEFRQLAVQTYANPQNLTLTVEIYRHDTVESAFGIYSQEKPVAAGDYLPLGGQGYYEEGVMNFFCGPYYVKLNGFNLGPTGRQTLLSFARAVEKQIAVKAELPPLLSCFPAANRIPDSERFVLKNVMGYDFLHSGYSADYRIREQGFQLFIILGRDEADARNMRDRLIAKAAAKVNGNECPFSLRDPYLGPLWLCCQGRFLWGLSGQLPPAPGAYLLEIKKNLSGRHLL